MNPQTSFLTFSESFRKTLRCEKFLREMNAVIPWNKLVNTIKPYYTHRETGRKRKHLTMMLKIHFLQHWYNLSDPQMEDAIYDRNSFQKFLEIDMMKEKAPSSTKNVSGKRDPEMGSTKKGNNWYFGMKAHTGTDKESGLVHTLEVSSASVHDSTMFEDLLHGKEKEVYGDRAYHNSKKALRFRKKGIQWRVHQKAGRGKELTPQQEERNNKLSSVRWKVEKPFFYIKHLWNYKKVRYRGLYKNKVRLSIGFMLANLCIVKKKLLTT